MKKKTPRHTKKPSIAWGDDEPAAPAQKSPPPKKMSPVERKAAAKRNSAAIQGYADDDDDLIGEAPKPKPAASVVITNVAVEQGVYLDRNRYSAIVIGVVHGRVQSLCMTAQGVEYLEQPQDQFAQRFVIALPQYPVRRAARLYLESPQPKDTKADRALRGLLHA